MTTESKRLHTGGKGGSGFTLIEVMVVVAVVGILAAIAYPSYTEHVRKARRADAQASLMELAQFMERYYTSHGRYLSVEGDPPSLPFAKSPKEGDGKSYDLAFAKGSPTATSYVLEATPSGPMTNDACGTLSLSHTGARGQSAGNAASCWHR